MVLGALSVYLYSQGASFFEHYLVSGDTSLVTFWFYEYFGTGQFQPNDPSIEISRMSTPLLYSGFMSVLCTWIDPLLVSKLLPLLLYVITCAVLYRVLNWQFGGWLAIAGTVLIATSEYFLVAFPGGYQKAFAFLLLLLFWWAWLGKHYVSAALVLAVCAALYPITFLLLCSMTGFSIVRSQWKNAVKWRLPLRQWAVLAAMLVGGLFLLWNSHQLASHALIGEMYSGEEITQMPEFARTGRVRIMPQLEASAWLQAATWFGKGLPGAAWINFKNSAYLYSVLSCMVIMVVLWSWQITKKGWKEFDSQVLFLGVAGVVLFLCAREVLLTLYIPSRYLAYALPVVAALVLLRLLNLAGGNVPRVAGIAALVLLPVFTYTTKQLGLRDFSNGSALYEHLEQLEEPALIAGIPGTCNMIPVFSRHSVLLSEELSHAVVYKKAWAHFKPLTYELFDAYLATEKTIILDFIEKHEIDYLVIEPGLYQSKQNIHFSPFLEYVNEQRATRQPADYAMVQFDKAVVIPVDEQYQLLDCAKLLQQEGRLDVVAYRNLRTTPATRR